MRRFPQLILSVSNHGKAAAMAAWRLASRLSARPAVRVLVSSHLAPCLVPPCCSKQETAFSSITVPSLSRAPLHQILRSLPRCPFRLVPRPVLRLAHRLVLLPSRFVSPFSSRPVLPDVPNDLPPVLRSRRFVKLISSLSPCFAVLAVLAASCPDDAGRARTPHNGFVASK